MKELTCIGVTYNDETHKKRTEFKKITTKDSFIECYVVSTVEELMIINDCFRYI